MNILVVNGYVRQNKGDAVLMSVLCYKLQKAFPTADIKISSQENPQQHQKFEHWQNVGSFNLYCFDPNTGKLSHLLRLFLSCIVINVLSNLPHSLRKKTLQLLPQALQLPMMALHNADLVVSMGGGYLNGDKSLMAQVAVYLMLAPLKLAKRFGACAVCAPQSMGPFATTFQKTIVAQTLKKVDLILTREKKTTKLLAELYKNLPIVASVDSGFLFKIKKIADLRNQLQLSPNTLLAGVTVRKWLDPKRQHKYELAMAAAIDYLASRYGAEVVLIPQVTSVLGGDDDRLTAKKVYAKTIHKNQVHVLEDDYTHQQIKSIYNALDIIIGTRFHSVIFSLTSRVPALAIEYEHKTSGIMHDLGLDNWVIKIEDATPKTLLPKIDELITAKENYKEHLNSVLPDYIAKAGRATTLIKQAYKAHQPEPITK